MTLEELRVATTPTPGEVACARRFFDENPSRTLATTFLNESTGRYEVALNSQKTDPTARRFYQFYEKVDESSIPRKVLVSSGIGAKEGGMATAEGTPYSDSFVKSFCVQEVLVDDSSAAEHSRLFVFRGEVSSDDDAIAMVGARHRAGSVFDSFEGHSGFFQYIPQGKMLVDALGDATDEDRLNYAFQIVTQVRALHHKGRLHREIQLDRVVMDDSRGSAALFDFGTSVAASSSERCQTPFHTLELTSDSMAPECQRKEASDSVSYSFASDYYSLAVLLKKVIPQQSPLQKVLDLAMSGDPACRGNVGLLHLCILFEKYSTETDFSTYLRTWNACTLDVTEAEEIYVALKGDEEQARQYLKDYLVRSLICRISDLSGEKIVPGSLGYCALAEFFAENPDMMLSVEQWVGAKNTPVSAVDAFIQGVQNYADFVKTLLRTDGLLAAFNETEAGKRVLINLLTLSNNEFDKHRNKLIELINLLVSKDLLFRADAWEGIAVSCATIEGQIDYYTDKFKNNSEVEALFEKENQQGGGLSPVSDQRDACVQKSGSIDQTAGNSNSSGDLSAEIESKIPSDYADKSAVMEKYKSDSVFQEAMNRKLRDADAMSKDGDSRMFGSNFLDLFWERYKRVEEAREIRASHLGFLSKRREVGAEDDNLKTVRETMTAYELYVLKLSPGAAIRSGSFGDFLCTYSGEKEYKKAKKQLSSVRNYVSYGLQCVTAALTFCTIIIPTLTYMIGAICSSKDPKKDSYRSVWYDWKTHGRHNVEQCEQSICAAAAA